MNKPETIELQRLVSLHLDGDLDDTGMSHLSRQLVADENAMDVFVDLASIHSSLLLLNNVSASDHLTENQHDNAPEVATSSSSSRSQQSGSPQQSWVKFGLVGLAASVLTMIGMQFMPNGGTADTNVRESANTSNDVTLPTAAMVAEIVRKVDCDWEGDRWSVATSSKVRAGQNLTMSRGLMELQFTSGARVTLEAPVSFSAESAMRGTLAYGKLTADVPESAHGFTVQTPSGETIDLGTRFGLLVTEDGGTETHVFDGDVIVRSNGNDDDETEMRLSSQSALLMNRKGKAPVSMPAVPQRFASLQFEDLAAPRPVADVDRGLRFWLSADRQLKLDESGKVVTWGGLPTTEDSDIQNAWQVDSRKRPVWVEDAIGGRPAVKFTGREFMITEPMTLGSSQTIAVVFRADVAAINRKGANQDIGRQLINLNGPPSLVLAMNPDRFLVGRAFAGSNRTKNNQRIYRIAGRTVAEEPLTDQPMVAIYVYDSEGDSSRLYMNGKLVDSAPARIALQQTNSPRYIGAHMFLPRTQFIGDIAEMMIYDTGLTENEVDTLSSGMMKKYSIAVSEQ